MIKRFRSLIFLVVILIMSTGIGEAKSPVKIKKEVFELDKLDRLREDIVLDVDLPIIENLIDHKITSSVNSKLNREIEGQVKDFIAKAERKSFDEDSRLKITYEIKSRDSILSIVFKLDIKYAGSTRLEEKKLFYNIDLKTGRFLKLEDLFLEDSDYLGLLNRAIEEEIKSSPGSYYSGNEGFKGLNKDSDFYYSPKGLVIGFQLYEIGPRNLGFPEFNMAKEAFKILKDQYRKDFDLEIEIENQSLKVPTEEDIIINLPYISGFLDQDFERDLNEKIRGEVDSTLKSFRHKASLNMKEEKSDLSISYEIKSRDNILSLVINQYTLFAGEAQGDTIKTFYNIDIKNGRYLDLGDLFMEGVDYRSLIDEKIREQIKERPGDFFSGDKGFKGIDEASQFFVDEYGNIIVEFKKYAIGPGSTGTPQFRICYYSLREKLNKDLFPRGLEVLEKLVINNKVLGLKNPIYLSKQGNIMIPLKEVMEEMGIEVGWNKENRIVEIGSDDLEIGLSLDSNYYYSKNATVILNQQAQLNKGVSYVPKSFVDMVLGGKTFIDEEGRLNISYLN